MRPSASLGVIAAALLWQAPVQAQTLSDDFWINVQAYYPKVDTRVRVDANTEQAIGTDIDLERDLDLDGKEVLPAVSAGARFGRVVVGADFFRLKRSGSVGLAREIEFDGTTYPVNARVDSGFSSDVYRLTVGYAFVSQPDLEIGAALGLHATNFRVSLSGEASAGGEGVEVTARRKEVLAPLPTIGLFATWQPAPRVELTGRVDYLSLKISDYDGKLLNLQAGAAYRLFEHASLGLAYRYVDYRLGVEKDSWSGRVRYKLRGPALILQASF
ncbi:hypothetical protein A8V01_05240 [Novosphingobium guangzhouense]|uniref:Outer membrane protein beta-barrel domain-containing protein n=1 Tax=Novosphingobium guangzhouense TaxID=1850347 RepID=A0A2K2FZE4_9SPHN|nr:hypothetical protein A8V01_05240 [Novosphingobium guangzhouense]